MTLNSLVIRIVACGTAAASGFLYAAEAGLIQGIGPAHADTSEIGDRTLTSGSGPAGATTGAPVLRASFGNLPDAVQQAVIVGDTSNVFRPAPSTDGTQSAFGLACDMSVSATAMPAAMAALDVMAPCHPNTTITVIHAGLELEAQSDAMGLLTMDIPAFTSPAYFEVRLDTANIAESTTVELPDFAEFNRVALAWHGAPGLELHATYTGSDFDLSQRVGTSVYGQPADAANGFMTVLDTGTSHAQIFTLPHNAAVDGGDLVLSVDAEVTPENCAQPISARTVQTRGAGTVDVTEISLTMPSCDAVGDVLVLQNVVSDLRLAAN